MTVNIVSFININSNHKKQKRFFSVCGDNRRSERNEIGVRYNFVFFVCMTLKHQKPLMTFKWVYDNQLRHSKCARIRRLSFETFGRETDQPDFFHSPLLCNTRGISGLLKNNKTACPICHIISVFRPPNARPNALLNYWRTRYQRILVVVLELGIPARVHLFQLQICLHSWQH